MLTSSTTATLADPVSAVLDRGVLVCDPDTPLAQAAEVMARQRVHGLVVAGPVDRRKSSAEWLVLSAADAVRALLDGTERVGEAAATEIPSVLPWQSLQDVARTMLEHEVDHVLVVGDDGPHGVLSHLDVLTVATGVAR